MKNAKSLLSTFIASMALSHSTLAIDSFAELDREHAEAQRSMAYEFDGCSAEDLYLEKAKVKKLKDMMHERQDTIESLNKQISDLKTN